MRHSIEQRSQRRHAADRTGLELWSLTATAGAAALLMASSGVYAQQAPQPPQAAAYAPAQAADAGAPPRGVTMAE